MGFIELLAAAVVGGLFVLWGVNVQFRRQSEAACRALLVEIQSNVGALKEMVNRPVDQPWGEGKPNPGWLKRSVWESQLPYVVQRLDAPTESANILLCEHFANGEFAPKARRSSLS